jgi:hypothetical protein
MPLRDSSSTPDEKVLVNCLECGKENEVSARALTVTCRHCYKPLRLENIDVRGYDARRRIATAGFVTVEPRGQIVADRVQCGGLILRGKVKAKRVECQEELLIGPAGELVGEVTARTLAVGAGAVVDGHLTIGDPDELPWRTRETWPD